LDFLVAIRTALWYKVKTEEELNMLAQKSPAMKRATLRLLELSADDKARQLYEERLKEQRDNYAREKGAILNVARNALQKKMSVDDIVEITGLTRDEVEGLQATN